MIPSFRDAGAEDIFNGANTFTARQACPESLWKVAFRRLDQLDSVASLADLRVPPGNQLESLTGAVEYPYRPPISHLFRLD